MSTTTPIKTPKIHTMPRRGFGGHDFAEVDHIVDMHDPDTSLCGVDQTDVPWDQGFPKCEACMAILRGQMN